MKPSPRSSLSKLVVPLGLASLLGYCGCVSRGDRYDRNLVSTAIQARLGVGIAPAPVSELRTIPPGLATTDGVSATEAVAIALWNNAELNEALSTLGLARADLVQAGLLTNPTFSILFPLGPKQLEFAAKLPLEALWLMPQRAAIAELRCGEAAELLVKAGLNLASDVKKAHATWSAARAREALALELHNAAAELERIQTARFRAGDASGSDERLALAESIRTEIESTNARKDAAVAGARLEALVGVAALSYTESGSLSAAAVGSGEAERSRLIRRALAWRPDLRAAELELEGAGKRAGLARWEAVTLAGILDANGDGQKGFEAGPGVELTIPLFHWNDGAVARARAELERAALHYVAVRDAIALEVSVAHAEYTEAFAAAARWRELLLPATAEALTATEKSQSRGEASRADVLEGRRRLLKARWEHAGMELQARQAEAELERALGGLLDRDNAEVAIDAK